MASLFLVLKPQDENNLELLAVFSTRENALEYISKSEFIMILSIYSIQCNLE